MALSVEAWIAIGSGVLGIVATFLATRHYYTRSREAKREDSDVEMYGDIVRGLGPYNWWPSDVGPSDARYEDWNQQRIRLIRYKDFVPEDMKVDYGRLVPYLERPHPMSERNDANTVLRRVQQMARERLEGLTRRRR